jgi:hypothetical protein
VAATNGCMRRLLPRSPRLPRYRVAVLPELYTVGSRAPSAKVLKRIRLEITSGLIVAGTLTTC